MPAPELAFSYSKAKLGASDYIEVTFSADMDTSAFEARATRAAEDFGLGKGLLVGAFAATPAGVQRVFEIYDHELTKGDGEYRISLFAQSAANGSWNDNHGFFTSDGEQFFTSDGEAFLVGR